MFFYKAVSEIIKIQPYLFLKRRIFFEIIRVFISVLANFTIQQNIHDMKTKSLLLALTFSLVFFNFSNAQVGSSLRNRINKAINKDAQTKADSAVNKNQENQQDDQKTEGRSRGLGGILGGKTDIKHKDEYDFTGRVYMQMETYDKKDVTKSDYFTYFNSNTPDAGIEVRIEDPEKKEASVPTQFIFDGENRCFMILMQGEDSKTGIISTIPDDSTLAAQTKNQKTDEVKKPVITKTGNSRVIAGYNCDEYKIVEPDNDGYSNAWMTKDVKIKADKKNWGKAGMPTYYNYPGFENSMMLATEVYDKNNKLEMKMETREINDSFRHSISTVGYSFIKMNFGQAGKK